MLVSLAAAAVFLLLTVASLSVLCRVCVCSLPLLLRVPLPVKGWVPNYLRLGPHFVLSLPLAEYIRRQLGADSM